MKGRETMWKDAIEMREAVASGEISPKELVQETLDKIEQRNPSLNAVVHLQAERPLEEAEARSFEGLPIWRGAASIEGPRTKSSRGTVERGK